MPLYDYRCPSCGESTTVLVLQSTNHGVMPPAAPGHVQRAATEDKRPMATGHGQRAATGDNQPADTGHVQRAATEDKRPMATGHVQRAATVDNQPMATGHVQRATTENMQRAATDAPACAACGTRMKRAPSSFAYHRSEQTRLAEAGDPDRPGRDYYKDPRNIGRWGEKRFREMGMEMPGELKEKIAASRDGVLPQPLQGLSQ